MRNCRVEAIPLKLAQHVFAWTDGKLRAPYLPNPDYLLVRGITAFILGDRLQASEDVKSLFLVAPCDGRAMVFQAVLLADQGSYKDAQLLLREGEKNLPKKLQIKKKIRYQMSEQFTEAEWKELCSRFNFHINRFLLEIIVKTPELNQGVELPKHL